MLPFKSFAHLCGMRTRYGHLAGVLLTPEFVDEENVKRIAVRKEISAETKSLGSR